MGEVISDITYDRSKVTEILFENLDEINEMKAKYDQDMKEYEAKTRKKKPTLNPPTLLSFIRAPFCASFKVKGDVPGYEPYCFMHI
mmetsp:Transcript_14158/g.17189  ORF Transcript_14158/g.17189 Transcript_14158/m.17189 type:complete len:86 (-) Transcript_14158:91-348(-)